MWLNQDIVAAQEAEVEVIVLSIVAYSPRGRVAYFKISGYFMGYFIPTLPLGSCSVTSVVLMLLRVT
jgi:hypothetical protein